MRVAIIGAGPAGFFTAGELLKKLPDCDVHMFEKRVAPYGLVRFGVAPDHPMTRRVTRMFDQIADNPRFSYLGNVDVGKDISLEKIRASYHAVVLCSGAEQPSRPDLPGADLPGVFDALDFSRWTNGEEGAFAAEALEGVSDVVVVGNGNVALDVVRMLGRSPEDWLETDIAPYAMEALSDHPIQKIKVIGRRRPEDASFTEAELEEVVMLPGWKIESGDILPFGLNAAESTGQRQVEFRFNLRPHSLVGTERVSAIQFIHAKTSQPEEVSAQLVFFATGHRGVPLNDLPFDASLGVIKNSAGRVEGAEGMYVCGWIKRGSKGLIGHNRKDAIETVKCLVEDAESLSQKTVDDCDWPSELAGKGIRVVTWLDWLKISETEIERGSAMGRPRLRFSAEEALSFLS